MGYRILVFDGGFGVERLRVIDTPDRAPGHGEVRVRVEAVSLNRRDLLLVQGSYNPRQQLPATPCSDAAGVIESVGQGCNRLRAGERVVVHMMPDWISGEIARERIVSALGGAHREGTAQQYLIVPEAAVLPLPEALSIDAAATLPCAAVTAWSAIVELGRIKPGDTVVIQGTGGVSLFALQFAKMNGARIIAATSSDVRAQRLKALGADEVLNYRSDPKWSYRARELADDRIDLVVDVAGGSFLDQSVRMVRAGGTVAMIGVLDGGKSEITMPLAVMRQIRLQGVTLGNREHFEQMLRAIAKHGIDPVIDSRFALDDARGAFQRMADNAHIGKILLLPHG